MSETESAPDRSWEAPESAVGAGCLALLGGGEFSFGETLDADSAWLTRVPEGWIGFLPTASGSPEYGENLAVYMAEAFEREVRTIPIYRRRDAARGKNLDRLRAAAAVYIGGGVAEDLVEVLAESRAADALLGKLRSGGVVTAVAAAAQATGRVLRALGGQVVPGLGWLPATVVEANFDPGHDRRLRQLLAAPGVARGFGIPSGSAVLLGPEARVEVVGGLCSLDDAEGDFIVLEPLPETATPPSGST